MRGADLRGSHHLVSAPGGPAVLFDVDGPLVDSNYLQVIAWTEASGRSATRSTPGGCTAGSGYAPRSYWNRYWGMRPPGSGSGPAPSTPTTTTTHSTS